MPKEVVVVDGTKIYGSKESVTIDGMKIYGFCLEFL